MDYFTSYSGNETTTASVDVPWFVKLRFGVCEFERLSILASYFWDVTPGSGRLPVCMER